MLGEKNGSEGLVRMSLNFLTGYLPIREPNPNRRLSGLIGMADQSNVSVRIVRGYPPVNSTE